MAGTKLYFDDFGANTKPGTTDMTATFRAALEAAQDGALIRCIPGSTYKITDHVTVTNNDITIDRRGATIDGTEMDLDLVQNEPDALFRVQGAVRLSTTLAADAAEGATTITVADATGVELGDPLFIESDGELWYTVVGTAVNRQVINRVKAISGTTITLAWPLKMSFDATSNTPVVNFWNCVKNFTMLGGRSFGGGVRNDPDNPGTYVGNGKGAGDVLLEYVDGARIEIDYLEGFQGVAVMPKYCMDVHIEGGTIRGHQESYVDPVTGTYDVVEGRNSGFYGVFFFDTHGGSLRNTVSYRTRHHQDAASSSNILVQNNSAYVNHRPPFGSHNGAVDFVFDGNFCEEGEGGILWRGHDMTAKNNVFSCLSGASSAIYDAEGAAADIPKNYVLQGNICDATRNGLLLVSNLGFVRSSGNVWRTTDAGYSPVDITTLDLDTATFDGDHMETAGQYCLIATNNSPRTRKAITIKDCRMTGYTLSPARFFGTGIARFEDNLLDSNDVNFDDGTGFVADGANYGVDGTLRTGRQSWTPAMEDGSSNAVTLSTAYGHYAITPAGVHLSGRITASSLGSASGAIKITGLPFTAVNVGSYEAVGIVSHFDCNLPIGSTILCQIDGNTNELLFYVNDTVDTVQRLTAAELSDNGRLHFEIVYAI